MERESNIAKCLSDTQKRCSALVSSHSCFDLFCRVDELTDQNTFLAAKVAAFASNPAETQHVISQLTAELCSLRTTSVEQQTASDHAIKRLKKQLKFVLEKSSQEKVRCQRKGCE